MADPSTPLNDFFTAYTSVSAARVHLGLRGLATQNGTFSGNTSGINYGRNGGDQFGDNITVTVAETSGKIESITPPWSLNGPYLVKINDEGEWEVKSNFSGLLDNWEDIASDDDRAVVTVGLLKSLGFYIS